MARVLQHTPFFFAHDLERSCAFFASLGFGPRLIQSELGYAYCPGEGAALRLLESGRDQPISEQIVCFDVDDTDAVYADLLPVLPDLPEGRARAPFDQSYGQREFHVKNPDNCLPSFGAEIPAD